MSFALSRLERLYLQVETTYGQIPNTTGTATVGNSNACRLIKFSLENQAALIKRPDKTGTRSQQVGVLGRKFGTWSAEMSIAPNGVAGMAPDMDPLMQGIMGQAGTATSGTGTITGATNATPIVVTAANSFANGDVVYISGVTGNLGANGFFMLTAVSGSGFTLVGSVGTGVYVSGGTASRVAYKYTLSDSIPSLSLWSFRQPSTIDQRVGFGSVVQEMVMQLGQDVATIQFNGESLWSLQSNQFSVADLTQQGGLSAFPTEPSSPVTNGGMIAGFTGLLAVNGNKIATLRTASVRTRSANVTIKDTFGSYYPNSVEGDEREITIDMSIYEDDSATYQNLIALSQNKTPVTIPMVVGTQSGSVMVLVMNNVQLAAPTHEEQRRYIANWSGSTAHGSSLTARDELVCWFL